MKVSDSYTSFDDSSKSTNSAAYDTEPNTPYLLGGILLAIFMTTFSIFLLVMCFTPNHIIQPVIESTPNTILWKQFSYPQHIYPTSCTNITCPILSYIYHKSLSENTFLDDETCESLSDILMTNITNSTPKLFDGLYDPYSSPRKFAKNGLDIDIVSLESVYSVEQAKTLIKKSPVILTLINATNNCEIEGNTVEIPVESGRTFHVTQNVSNNGIKTFCVVGWDDTFAGGGFIIHGGIHSMGFYTGNVSTDYELQLCQNSRGSVDWIIDTTTYEENSYFDDTNTATMLKCNDPKLCKELGFYTIALKNPTGSRMYQVRMRYFDENNKYTGTLYFESIQQYELEYLFDRIMSKDRDPYCAYSFLSYSAFNTLKKLFILIPEMDYKQYSVAFTAYEYIITSNSKGIDIKTLAKEKPNKFTGKNLIFPE
ncbi:hypothetical protein EIN_034580 [Entamoeba invadens IP1]|uniref:Uncharacterized protein n=1 Tax=Entamoeba invadens IP1 TaxID=370355 RepID=A0A0A1TYC0_ENTIV|nr:hypothetical protein EIN_034580 [Entamoeba invadens IP1]ELP86517.1 hypothetical protein EIN_034580 [Entamoeba invadens IP1]|eukprot:XP_004185863.1 hypothetical protein EIN_034580 [Entamoeba invadens IP1]